MFVLGGGGSYDVDGDSLTYSWSRLSGQAVVLAEATTAEATFKTPTVASPTTWLR
jgi:chitinase